jgi:hypothetical protein
MLPSNVGTDCSGKHGGCRPHAATAIANCDCCPAYRHTASPCVLDPRDAQLMAMLPRPPCPSEPCPRDAARTHGSRALGPIFHSAVRAVPHCRGAAARLRCRPAWLKNTLRSPSKGIAARPVSHRPLPAPCLPPRHRHSCDGDKLPCGRDLMGPSFHFAVDGAALERCSCLAPRGRATVFGSRPQEIAYVGSPGACAVLAVATGATAMATSCLRINTPNAMLKPWLARACASPLHAAAPRLRRLRRRGAANSLPARPPAAPSADFLLRLVRLARDLLRRAVGLALLLPATAAGRPAFRGAEALPLRSDAEPLRHLLPGRARRLGPRVHGRLRNSERCGRCPRAAHCLRDHAQVQLAAHGGVERGGPRCGVQPLRPSRRRMLRRLRPQLRRRAPRRRVGRRPAHHAADAPGAFTPPPPRRPSWSSADGGCKGGAAGCQSTASVRVR